MVVLADTSVWIDLLKERDTWQCRLFQRAAREEDIVVGDLIVAEVLQGLRNDAEFSATVQQFGEFKLVSVVSPELAVRAADNDRLLRKRGITVRGTIDVLIATWCIENDVAIIHNDRDMGVMERELGLRAYA